MVAQLEAARRRTVLAAVNGDFFDLVDRREREQPGHRRRVVERASPSPTRRPIPRARCTRSSRSTRANRPLLGPVRVRRRGAGAARHLRARRAQRRAARARTAPRSSRRATGRRCRATPCARRSTSGSSPAGRRADTLLFLRGAARPRRRGARRIRDSGSIRVGTIRAGGNAEGGPPHRSRGRRRSRCSWADGRVSCATA